MSIELMSRVYEKNLDATQQRVLLLLADMANYDNYCWPSLGRLAWKLGLSEKTVRNNIRDLEKRGAITRHERPGRSNIYEIHLSALPDKPPYRGKVLTLTPPVDVTPPVGGRAPVEVTPTPPVDDSPPSPGTPGDPSPPAGPITPREPSGEPSEEPPGKKPRPHTLPERFRVTDQMRAWAHEKFNVTDEWIDEATEDFIDYWTSEGRKKVDWVATWRGSLRRQHERTQGRMKPAANRVVADHRDADNVNWLGRYGGQG